MELPQQLWYLQTFVIPGQLQGSALLTTLPKEEQRGLVYFHIQTMQMSSTELVSLLAKMDTFNHMMLL